MFEQTRKRLTLMYSGMLALILLVVFVGFYWTLSAIMLRNEQAQLEAIGEKAIHEWKESRERKLLPQSSEEEGLIVERRMDFDFLQPNQLFMLVTKEQQLFKLNAEHDSQLASAIQKPLGGSRISP